MRIWMKVVSLDVPPLYGSIVVAAALLGIAAVAVLAPPRSTTAQPWPIADIAPPTIAHVPDVARDDAARDDAAARAELELAALVAQNRPSLRACLDRAPRLDEALQLRVLITQAGRLSDLFVAEGRAPAAVVGCLARVVSKWTFPSRIADYQAEIPVWLEAN